MILINVSRKLLQTIAVMLFLSLSTAGYSYETGLVHIHTDHLGSPVMATAEDGSVLWREDYQPYGKKLLNEDSDNSVGYTGHLNEGTLNVTYMQGRWYHPDMGRFMAIDPVGFVEENPISFNRYVYANSNPYKFVDPDGNEAVPHIGPYLRGQFLRAEMQVYMMYGQFLMEEGATSAIGLGAGRIAGFAIKQAIKRAAPLVSGFTKGIAGVPGRVQSRINVSNEGWEHVLKRHFSGKSNASQFSVSQSELKSLLQSKQVVGSPVTRTVESADGLRYVREIDMGRTIGVDAMNGNAATSVLTTMSDKYGNLVTAFPGILK